MTIDPDNAIVRLCAAGMDAEAHDQAAARALFERAWREADTSYEACISAHYLARHQPTPAATLEWNRIALEKAWACEPELVAGFLPSLELCLGVAYEAVGETVAARAHLEAAEAAAMALGDDGYGQMIERGIAAALARVRS
ncbi:MAG: hypothetical protein ABI467_21445 [Kofleriaceae bacterium]